MQGGTGGATEGAEAAAEEEALAAGGPEGEGAKEGRTGTNVRPGAPYFVLGGGGKG